MNWLIQLFFGGDRKKAARDIPRSQGVTVSPRDDRDYRVVIPGGSGIPDEFDIPMPPIRNQGSMESCTAFATVACIESTLLNFYPEKFIELSESYNWYHSRKDYMFNYPMNKGVYPRCALQALVDLGVAPEVTFPYFEEPSKKPTLVAEAFAKFFKIASYARVNKIDDFYQMISNGIPIACGIYLKEDFFKLNSTNYNYLMTGKQDFGGHYICAYGYDKTRKVILLRNSWGSSWGNSGNFEMDIDLFICHSFDWFSLNIAGENGWIKRK